MSIHCGHTSQCERITECDQFVCDCGNNTFADGFFPCDENGKEVEPTREKWPVWRYVCASCGAIVTETEKIMSNQTTEQRSEIIDQIAALIQPGDCLSEADGFLWKVTKTEAVGKSVDISVKPMMAGPLREQPQTKRFRATTRLRILRPYFVDEYGERVEANANYGEVEQ